MFKGLRRFIERGRKGYCSEDLWNWDHIFSNLITRSLKDFKTRCHTYPGDGITWEEWMKTLDEMIECFEEQTRDIDTNCWKDDPKNPHLRQWDVDLYKRRQQHQVARLHRGLELLEKYYYDLWD